MVVDVRETMRALWARRDEDEPEPQTYAQVLAKERKAARELQKRIDAERRHDEKLIKRLYGPRRSWLERLFNRRSD